MKEAKIKLSANELQLVQDGDIILTKNTIIQKIIRLFSLLAENMQEEIQNFAIPEEITAIQPKISKGENYKGLPYVILDYPRLFNRESVFAVRTMFWWGKYFSTTIHLKGIYKEKYSNLLYKNAAILAGKHFRVATSNDEWQHEHEHNYIPLSYITEKEFAENIQSKPYLKLSARTELSQWNNCEEILTELFRDVLQATQSA
ncbi:MAG TPA: hypothetical protein VMT76_15270 [Puia sp.]|nr:hypothetical protein [Puia sp.]